MFVIKMPRMSVAAVLIVSGTVANVSSVRHFEVLLRLITSHLRVMVKILKKSYGLTMPKVSDLLSE